MESNSPYSRDMRGYGQHPPKFTLPDGKRIAVQFVVNYEEGGENSVLHGDPGSEVFLSEMFNPSTFPDRHMSMESLYEYGSRAGFWRLYRLFTEREVPITVFGVTMALARNPEAVAAMRSADWEIACHGLRWINYQEIPIDVEREHMQRAIEWHTELTGERPLGWYTGRDSPNTRTLLMEHEGFLYDSDSYADDLPYWVDTARGDHLVIPYTLDSNDMRFSSAQGFAEGDQFYRYLRDTFDVLYAEGLEQPKLMNIGLHCRLVGRPGRFLALQRFLDYVQQHNDAWLCRRVDIARHWHAHYQPSSQ
ncbi:allantoinase PuuE [Congregibacter variabilis]|uniref:Allantoinase PuuE n=1 Tax=Congregibacter variabilis TaxID=3081200 RepID=A0ABZ0I4A0_9GAMM|nr:allantoinase PuuE [Congregibacter sp. IMCC43200]